MSASSVRIFGCPTCGFRVDTNETSCPRCGNEFKDDTKFECPFCGDLVQSGLDECPSCHVSYSEFKSRAAPKATDDSIDSLLMEIIKLESTSIKEEEKRFSCPKCDLLLEGTETQCPRCGKGLDVEVALQCPVCGGLVGANDVRCGECGTVFDEGAAAAARTEEAESKLEEIMSITSPSLPVRRESRPPPEVGPVSVVEQGPAEMRNNMISRPREVAKAEPERMRPPPPPPAPPPAIEEPEPEPVEEPPPTPPVAVAEEAPELSLDEFEKELDQLQEVTAAPATKKAPSSAGKKKTRKLKAKAK